MSVMIMIRQRQLSDDRRCIFSLVALLLLICLVTLSSDRHQVSSFHLSFSHRLLKSASNPQLNPASTLIRPIECRNANNQSEVGICMFSIDCMQNKGTPLSVCKHNYFVGTCCRLPDYNNFVGIVYDLRDTEGQLEVRRIPLDKLHQVTPDAAYTPTSVIPASPTTTAASSDLLMASSRAELDQQSPVVQASSTVSSEEPLKDKYMVSSTSLFSTQTYPTTTISDRAEGSGTGSEAHQVRVGETARNADGVVPQPLAVQQAAVFNGSKSNKLQQQQQSMVVVSSEQDSFQIHSDATMSTRLTSSSVTPVDLSPPPATLIQVPTSSHHHHQQQQQQVSVEDSSKQQSAYELIKDDNLDILATVNSVHSAPTTQQQQQQQQQFNVITDHQDAAAASPPAKKVAQVAAADSSDLIGDSKPTPVQQSSVYLVDEQLQKQSKIVIANNHQYLSASGGSHASSTQQPPEVAQTQPPPSTSGLNLKVQSGQQPPSDQEFTLSSAPPAPSSTEDSHSTTEQRSTRPSSAAPEVLHINLTSSSSSSSSSSPFVDLVSNSNPSQSTTPFTTSLSTALLPNVSSHPYAPTAAPNSPVADISSLVSNKLGGGISQTSSRPHESGSLGLSQLYNGQQGSNSAGETVSGSQAPQSTSYLSRPNTNHMSGSGLQVASKIVTGSGSLPQNNNHIPGLSGLQSAILSHIPFKIASGLSSGLSSYLQAAMKPTGSRPLLSSNTAPSLQYQQQMQQQAANASKPQQVLVAASSGVRFPSTTGAAMPLSDAQPADEQQAANSSSLLAAVAAATGGSTSAEVLRDVVKEAQLVCGRPQVPAGGPTDTKKRVARIVGGNQSLFGQWPWMVSLRQWRKGAFLHKCGAALLNENWAITAAHCVENVKVTDLLLRLGEFDVSNQNEPYPYIERRVKSVVSHPSFDPKTFEYDLALLRFAEPIKYERNIVPVCVPSGNDTYVDRMATVIGWGRLYEDGPLPDVIQHVDVPIITNNECEKMYKNAGYIEEIPDMFICAGISKGGRDSCEGDSGGPLTMIDYDGRSYLVGIISWGIGCALPSQPGVYTRITAFSGWINQITAF